MNIRQLQISYIAEQDRLLTRINTQDGAEVRLWLTRRLVRRLWPGLIKASEAVALEGRAACRVGEARGMMTDMAREAALSQADFSTPFESQPASLPLGQEPLLVTRVDLSPQPGAMVKAIFRQDEQRGLQVSMTEALLHAFCRLVQSETQKAEWDFSLQWGATPAQTSAAPPSLN